MKDEAKKRLKGILGAYDEKLAETERREAASRAAKAAFPERFSALKKEMLLPVLGELAEVLNAGGHEAAAHEQEESSSTAGGVKSAAVSLRVIPKPFAHKSTEPNPTSIEVTFAANRSDRTVTVSSTNTMLSHGGSVGKRGAYEIDAVTVDVVASHVIQTLHDAFGGQR